MPETMNPSLPETLCRDNYTNRRIQPLWRALPMMLKLAWSYCLATKPSETFTLGVQIRGEERQITVDAFYPRRKKAKPNSRTPAVILLHGVDGATQYASLHFLVARALTDQGYAVYFVHYFDSVEYKDLMIFDERSELDVPVVERFCERDSQCWIAAVTGALRQIAARPEVDRRQVALFGYSLGCFVSLSAAEESLRQKDLPKVAAVVGHWGAKFREANFSAGFPPTRLFHGAQDTVIRLEWARQTLDTLRAIGVDADLMEIPGQGHRATSRKAWRETLAFLKQRVIRTDAPSRRFATGINDDSRVCGSVLSGTVRA